MADDGKGDWRRSARCPRILDDRLQRARGTCDGKPLDRRWAHTGSATKSSDAELMQ